VKMYSEIIKLYNDYLKFLYNFKVRSPILSVRMTDVSLKVKQYSISDIFTTYESFDAML